MTEYTKKQKTKRNIYFTISSMLWLGTLITLAIIGVARKQPSVDGDSFTVKYGTVTVSILLSSFIVLLLFLIIKERLRNTVWMASLVYSLLLFNRSGAYVVLAIWAFDEYIIKPLYTKYKNRYIINKEIDKRE